MVSTVVTFTIPNNKTALEEIQNKLSSPLRIRKIGASFTQRKKQEKFQDRFNTILFESSSDCPSQPLSQCSQFTSIWIAMDLNLCKMFLFFPSKQTNQPIGG